MRLRTAILGLAALSTLAGDSASAQSRTGPVGATQNAIARNRYLTERRGFDSGNKTQRSALGTYQVQRYQGFKTRGDRWRAANWYASLMRDSRSPVSSSVSPIEQILNQRNLLSARSPLSQMLLHSNRPPLFLTPWPQDSTTSLPSSSLPSPKQQADGPQGSVAGAADVSASKSAVPPNTDPAATQLYQQHRPDPGLSPVESLKERIKARSLEYYSQGLAHFRKQDFLKAKNSFELARELQPESTPQIIACLFASHFRGDFMQAELYIERLLATATKLDDMKVDLTTFDITTEKLQRLIDQTNLISQQSPNAAGPHSMLAYLSYLRGDYSNAAQAASTARDLVATSSGSPDNLQRFVDGLKAAQAQAPGLKR